MTDRALDLSLLDPDNLDFSELPRYPKSLQIVNNEAIVTYSDDTEDNLGIVTLPAANTIESAEVNASGRLIVNYVGGGSADVGKVKGVRNVPLLVSGQGVLTSRTGNALTFTPIPFDNTTVRMRTLQNHTKVQEELLMLKSTQLDITDLVRLQQRNSEALLKKLEALDKKVEALSIKVD